MQVLKQSTQIKVRLGAFVASTDGVTPTTSATIAAADQAEILKANGAATVALTTSDTFTTVAGAQGWYDLTLTTAHTNTVGHLEVVMQDSSAYCPVLARFQVVEESIYDALFGTGAAYPTNFSSLVVSTAGQVQTSNTLTTGDFPANFDNLAITTGGAVTVGTNNDKTGYSLSQAFPTNFANMALTTAGAVTVGTNNDKTGYSLSQAFPTNFANMALTTAGAVTVGTNNDKTGYSLSQAFPTNFSNMALTTGGAVTVGTNNDKTGYSLSQAFPTNFASLSITTGGVVSASLSAAERNAAADSILSRSVTNTQATAGTHSITSIILATLESSLSTGGTWTIKTTTGGTHMTQTATLSTSAKQITAVQ